MAQTKCNKASRWQSYYQHHQRTIDKQADPPKETACPGTAKRPRPARTVSCIRSGWAGFFGQFSDPVFKMDFAAVLRPLSRQGKFIVGGEHKSVFILILRSIDAYSRQ